ncbi:hypothetical protein BpHYR1_029376 [Brachionus plicatilis]|uniref:Uncharacterized protein n=1 Tax=Brachionus plicatilis TaxID=10195 RepID=A0A3M7PAB9_BRAPC|nr:hypothetical protein BpHYR1_029376 [Brachionus plicatilis]
MHILQTCIKVRKKSLNNTNFFNMKIIKYRVLKHLKLFRFFILTAFLSRFNITIDCWATGHKPTMLILGHSIDESPNQRCLPKTKFVSNRNEN